MRKLVIGILAHVDAGKTTLAESMLYQAGSIRKLGRVDHKNAFLDTHDLERERGITIFSKQAEMIYRDINITLLDTPGHVDFSSEMERTLQVLDYAILVISGIDGVQGHTQTLWRLLAKYHIPTFLFINKMDLERTNREALIHEMKKLLDDACIDFSTDMNSKEWNENIAVFDEALLDKYINDEEIYDHDIVRLIKERKIYPCYFGSALKMNGVESFLEGIISFTCVENYPEEFGAKVFKIGRDEQGARLTYMKITGGSLRVKTLLSNKNRSRSNELVEDIWEEKVDQIRIYSGVKYDSVEEAQSGTICVITGLSKTYPGEGLGIESSSQIPVLEPVLSYQIVLPKDCDSFHFLTKLKALEEEDPLMQIIWSEQLKEIHIKLMGEVQIEVLKRIIMERFGVAVEFSRGNIVYKETILEPVIGVGHFEPLRHYAEVHLLMEPNEPGGGLVFSSECSEDMLDRNWQRLILTHLEEKEHPGVLSGSSIMDMKITLIAGRAHLKHTEGGDFRQATYRAIRQGLKKANSILLEPYYNFRLEIPTINVGRAISDIQRMSGNFNPPETDGEQTIITGHAPVESMRGYQTEVTAYSKGLGRVFVSLRGYLPCHNQDQILDQLQYDSEKDIENPTSSVFCSHGAGFVVEWDEVDKYMHIDSSKRLSGVEDQNNSNEDRDNMPTVRVGRSVKDSWQEDKELEEIFTRTFGPVKQTLNHSSNSLGYEKRKPLEQNIAHRTIDKIVRLPEYLLVDGYNIIFSWEELSELAQDNMDGARTKLMDILCNYQGYKKCKVILVFDAYRVKGGVGVIQKYHNINVVYTKEAETADQYIEKITHDIGKKNRVYVATSDALEQMIIMGQGGIRLSANDLREEIARVNNQIRSDYQNKLPVEKSYLKEHMNDELKDQFIDE